MTMFESRLRERGALNDPHSCTLVGPSKLNHTWTLDLESGLPDVEGLTRAELKLGFRLFFVNKHDEALKFFETYVEAAVGSVVGWAVGLAVRIGGEDWQ